MKFNLLENDDESSEEKESQLETLRQRIEKIKAERDEAQKKAEEMESKLEEKKQAFESLEMDVGKLATVVMANAEGDLNELPDEPETEAAERIYNAYDDMIRQWRDTVEKMSSFSDQVGSSTDQVDKKIDNVKHASRNVSSAVNEISKGSETQNSRIQNISAEMENLSSTIQQIAASTDNLADKSSEAAERGSSAHDSAGKAMDELEKLTGKAEETVDNVEELNNLLGDIEDVVEFINDVANKTNILALNANVEAARAGEAGEGFTVVADEVKNLADETKEATNEIEESIREVHDQAAETVGKMHETKDTVDETREVVGKGLDELGKIVEQVEAVDESIQEIDDATESQASSTEDVTSMIDEVSDISDKTAEKAMQAEEAAQNQTTGLAEVSTRVSTLTDRAESLEKTLEEYKLSRDKISSEADETVVEFWHAMGGQKAVLLQELVNEFEEQNPEIKVKLSSKGSYRSTLESTISAAKEGQPPAIAQIFEIGTTRARESGYFRPVEGLIPSEHINSLVSQVSNYYKYEGTQYSVPFNSSNPILVINEEAFRNAGLDPENPPSTFEEVRNAAEKIVSEDAAEYGITFATYSWLVEQWFGEAGEKLVDQDNGRSGQPKHANFDTGFAEDLFNWWKGMQEDGLYYDPGIVARGEAKETFQDEDAAMLVGSTSSLGAIESGADFEVATGMMPVRDERNGVIVGGASLWVGADLEKEVHQAAAKFLEWLTKPGQQERWHKETGYFPVHQQAVSELKSGGWFEENPIYKVAFDQLEQTEDTIATRGAQIGPFDTIRTIVEEEIDSMNSKDDVTKCLERLNSQVEDALQDYASES